jgi:hypothetical protein
LKYFQTLIIWASALASDRQIDAVDTEDTDFREGL